MEAISDTIGLVKAERNKNEALDAVGDTIGLDKTECDKKDVWPLFDLDLKDLEGDGYRTCH